MKFFKTNKPKPEENPFFGIWDQKNQSVETPADTPVTTLTNNPANVARNKNRWGIAGAIAGLAFFLGIQVIVVIAIVQVLAVVAGDDVYRYAEDPLSLATHPAVIVSSSAAMWLSWVAWMWIVSRTKGTKSFFNDFNLKVNWKKDWWVGGLIGVGLILAVNLLTFLLELAGANMTGSNNGSVFGPEGGLAAALMAIFVASIAGPFFEEVFFRGYILKAVKNTVKNQYDASLRLGGKNAFASWAFKHKNTIAIILSSLVFGFMHFQGVETFGQWYVVFVTGSLGAVLAYTTLRSGRLGPAIFAHMVYNGGTLLLAWLTTL